MVIIENKKMRHRKGRFPKGPHFGVVLQLILNSSVAYITELGEPVLLDLHRLPFCFVVLFSFLSVLTAMVILILPCSISSASFPNLLFEICCD